MKRGRWLSIAGTALSAVALALVQGCSDRGVLAPTDPPAADRARMSTTDGPAIPDQAGLIFQHSSMYTFFPTLALDPAIPGDVWAIRDTGKNRLHLRIRAEGLEPGHVYSTIFFGFNNAAACVAPVGASPCGPFDLLGNPAAEATTVWVTAKIADDRGRLRESFYVDGDEPPIVVNGSGFIDYAIAQVSVSLRDQGPAQSDPALLEMQLSVPGSNCLTTSMGGGLGNGTYFCNVPQIAVLRAPASP